MERKIERGIVRLGLATSPLIVSPVSAPKKAKNKTNETSPTSQTPGI